MTYHLSKRLDCSFEEAVQRTFGALQQQGFGVLTDIDMQATLKTKLGVETSPYRILGACNPPLAYRALQAEDRIGLLLPCNVVVRAAGDAVEVSAVDPVVAMAGIDNPALAPVAAEVGAKLRAVIDAL